MFSTMSNNPIRPLHYFFSSLTILSLVIPALLSDASRQGNQAEVNRFKQTLARELQITDLVLTTESRHLRHISQPELMAVFQDVPGFHDHFPGSAFFNVYPVGSPDSAHVR